MSITPAVIALHNLVSIDHASARSGGQKPQSLRNHVNFAVSELAEDDDLLIAVYSQEVEELIRHGEALLGSDDPVDALFA